MTEEQKEIVRFIFRAGGLRTIREVNRLIVELYNHRLGPQTFDCLLRDAEFETAHGEWLDSLAHV